ncbi:ExbD/TolR family protein [Aliikangiella maris]|uniref:Biopolymer transporter ExbD n=2 Tax=Aliikangiella maris TaxID=3162458 RepID=A0ABV2BNZ4_9GAMM
MKKSYRAARMERHHKRFGSGGLNLVSLMDIFTILVFFLLVNSSNVQQLPSSKAIKLPESTAQQLPKETVIVLVNNQQILVQGRVITTVDKILATKEAVIPELLEEMKFQSSKSWQPANPEEGLEVTVMGDKEIPYRLLRKILTTLSQANYTNISMAVMKRADSNNQAGTR